MARLWIAMLIVVLTLAAASGGQSFGAFGSLEDSKIEPLLLFETSKVYGKEALDVYATLSKPITDELISQLSELGTVRSYTDILVTMTLDRKSLRELAQLPFIERVGGGRLYRIALDKSVPEIGADALWTQLRDKAGNLVTGAGIAIGIVDTGIDVAHPDFFFEDGTSKILFVWDQTVNGRPPIGFNYGSEWTRTDIERKIATATDTHGHGTHVAGIAASTGRASGKWSGVAPGARLIFVKSGRAVCAGSNWSFNDAELLDALTYIWKKSKSVGLKTVINLSLGGNIGGHDDTDPFETLLNQIVSDGIVVAVAAGNSGDDDIHAKGTLATGGSATAPFALDKDVTDLVVDFWHDLGDKFDVVVTTPDGAKVFGPTPPSGAQTESGLVMIGRSVKEKGVNWQIEVTSGHALKASGWSMTVAGTEVKTSGRWDAYIDTNSCESRQTGFTAFADKFGSVGVPATASKVIAVGAYVTQERFTTSVGSVGSLALFSSRGPTRDGRVKPDIAAPGADIISSLSSQGVPIKRLFGFGGDAKHVPLRGTSMAAPHVAGLAALLLQYNPTLTPGQLLEKIRAGARQDNFTGTIDPAKGTNIWGWGKVDARRSTSAFYSITVSFAGLQKGLRVNLTIDGSITQVTSYQLEKLWFLNGTSHRIAVPDIVQPTADVRYMPEKTSFDVKAPGTVIFKFRVQFLLTVKSNHIIPDGSGWYDSDTEVLLRAKEVDEQPGGIRFLFRGWIVNGSSVSGGQLKIKVDGPKIVEALYTKQYLLTITSDSLKPGGEGWYDEGAQVTLRADTTIDMGPGERIVFSNWKLDSMQRGDSQITIVMTSPNRVHATYTRQFLLTLVSPIGTVGGAGWFDAGNKASISITPTREGFLVQNVFSGWKGDFTGSSSLATITMDRPKRVEAIWVADYTIVYALVGLTIIIGVAGAFLIRRRKHQTIQSP